jgi:hypothetical protein
MKLPYDPSNDLYMENVMKRVIIVVKGIVLLSQKGFNGNENNIKLEA